MILDDMLSVCATSFETVCVFACVRGELLSCHNDISELGFVAVLVINTLHLCCRHWGCALLLISLKW